MESTRDVVLKKYMKLEQPEDVVFVTYVFVDGSLQNVRCKTRALSFQPRTPQECPEWTFCGIGTYQYTDAGPKSEFYLVPVALFKDPFIGGRNMLVLCEVLDQDRKPIPTNTRRSCYKAMENAAGDEPWFGIEQEYVILEKDDRPIGWPRDGGEVKQYGPYFYGVGTGNVAGRCVSIAHMKACAYAGVKICGVNAEVHLAQWEYQVGPLPGVEAGDHLWISRYILHRIAEEFGVKVTFNPKPYYDPDWLGSGGHINFSTRQMRQIDGIAFIKGAIEKLQAKADEHLVLYDPEGGKSNARRLIGTLGTPTKQFDAMASSREVSIRIPRLVDDAGCGYLEDRRPGANVEPYRATEAIVNTVCLS
ncbi:glutamine synthetase-like isoform X2 [Ornithodoros turicata]